MDPTARRRRIFWTTSLLAASLLAASVWTLARKAGEYWRFYSSGEMRALQRPAVVQDPPRLGSRELQPPEIQFVEFRLFSPEARSVGLAGSFNRWRPETMPMRSRSRGEWLLTVPLPAGTHYYAFLVDEKWTPDPEAPSRERRGGREVSVRHVR